MVKAGTSALAVEQYLIRAEGDDGRQLLFAILKNGGCAVFLGKEVLYVGAGDERGIDKGIDVLEQHASRSARAVASFAQTPHPGFGAQSGA
jgi:hypothetical protein